MCESIDSCLCVVHEGVMVAEEEAAVRLMAEVNTLSKNMDSSDMQDVAASKISDSLRHLLSWMLAACPPGKGTPAASKIGVSLRHLLTLTLEASPPSRGTPEQAMDTSVADGAPRKRMAPLARSAMRS
mmetsp:Transcript_34540/g.92410  ORF Transcript_34540/g.92410 Transcript_34540/m.92410 type:complete len:128 (-) Transcript_34540:361-744(-)